MHGQLLNIKGKNMDRVFIYDNNGYFVGESFPQIDPLESQLAGHEIFIMPANSTGIERPEDKEGFRIKWNGASWEYEEIEEVKEVKPELHEPTEADRLRERLYQIDEEFRKLDYIGIKIATGRATVAEYADEIAHMEELAEEKNEIMSELAEESEEVNGEA